MKQEFKFNLATRIEFGDNKLLSLGALAGEFGARKALIITDKGLSKTRILQDIRSCLEREGIDWALYDKVRENPRDSDAQAAYEEFKAAGIQLLIACGGGSSMDLAKAVSALFTNGGDISRILNPNKLTADPLPVICIPTTAGTGSEVTSFAVLTLEKEQRKSSVFDDRIRPRLSINDPQVLKSVPPGIAAATGMDALTHAIEAYTCRASNPLSDGMALHAIRYIAENIHEFVYEKTDQSCRAMMAGSLMAGIAFGFSDIAGVHCMAEALGGVYDTPHGVANSIFLPLVFEYNIEADVRRHSDAAIALGIEAAGKSPLEIAREGANWMRNMSEKLHIPILKELPGVTPDGFEMLADKCMKNVSLKSNARELRREDFIRLYRQAYAYER